MSNPRLIVAVMIDEPRGKGYGGTVAGPVFASVTSGSLQLLGVPPDAPVEPRDAAGEGRCAAKRWLHRKRRRRRPRQPLRRKPLHR